MFSELFALGYFIPTIAITTFSRKEDFYQKPPVYSENTILATPQHLPLDDPRRLSLTTKYLQDYVVQYKAKGLTAPH